MSKQEVEEQLPLVDYSDDEKKYWSKLRRKLEKSRLDRNGFHKEFNDMDYQTHYDSNIRASISYIPPKKNKEDSRVVTGTTEEKENTLLSALMNYNLEPNIMAFDKEDLEVSELGVATEDMVKKSREIEGYDDKRLLIYKELLDQGTCFVEERWIEETFIEKKITKANWADGVKIKSIKWEESEGKGFEGASVRLLRGDKVYLGNIREFDIRNQPFLFTVDTISYAEAKSVYGNWERFEYVPKEMQKIEDSTSTFRDFAQEDQRKGMVEVVKYQDRFNNEFMIVLNGIMMLPVGFPLTAVSPSGSYTIAKGDVYPMSQFFAYSKSIPAKTKVDQEILDEMMKLIVLKTRKSYMPPLANNTGRILSRKSLLPGEIINQVDPTRIQESGSNNGVTTSEFQAFEFIKRIVDEKSVSPAFMGENTSGRQTATEILEMKKQQMMKLGLVIFGIINLERQLSWLRIYTILDKWTTPIDKKVNQFTRKLEDVYRRIETTGTLESTQKGKKIVEFSPEAGNISPEQVMAEEDMLSEAYRIPTRKIYLHPDVKKMKYNWFVTINPTEKDSSDLQRILFKQDIQDAMTLFGPQTLNFDYLKQRFAVLSRQDPEKFFNKNAPTLPMEQAMQGGDQGGLGAQLNRGLGGGSQVEQPSINSLSQQ